MWMQKRSLILTQKKLSSEGSMLAAAISDAPTFRDKTIEKSREGCVVDNIL